VARAARFGPLLALMAGVGMLPTARAATDFCQKTSSDLLQACTANANGDYFVALGKCDNVSDPTARSACRTEAAADLKDAKKTCGDQFDARQVACRKLGGAPYDPVINRSNFVAVVNNPSFPLPPGRTLVYEGQTSEGFNHNDFIITRRTKVIQGVTCVEVHDVVYLDGVLAEDTLDWFAQDVQGNVWYFGENTGELKDGRFVTLDGTFTAGVNGDKAGIVMEAHPMVGDFYRQEFSVDNAEDLAEVLALNATVTVPAGTYTNCLKTQETTPLETSLLEDKYYAAGIGNVLTIDRGNGDRLALVAITTNSE